MNDGDDDSASAYTMTVNVSGSSDATLSAITVTGGTVHDFAADRLSYEVGVASTVSQTTVSATTTHIEASVEITPADADSRRRSPGGSLSRPERRDHRRHGR